MSKIIIEYEPKNDILNNFKCENLKLLFKKNKIKITNRTTDYEECIKELKKIISNIKIKNSYGDIFIKKSNNIYHKISIMNNIIKCSECFLNYNYEKNDMEIIKYLS